MCVHRKRLSPCQRRLQGKTTGTYVPAITYTQLSSVQRRLGGMFRNNGFISQPFETLLCDLAGRSSQSASRPSLSLCSSRQCRAAQCQ
jgi:hypothetical protein